MILRIGRVRPSLLSVVRQDALAFTTVVVYVTRSQNMLDPVYTFERFIYPFTRAKPDYFPLSALDIHHKAPACQSSVQSGSVLFTTSFSHMLQATGGWWQCVGCGDRQVSCVPQPTLSVKSADSMEAVTLVMEGLVGTWTCVQQPRGIRWTTGAFWPTILLYFTSNVSVSLSV